MENTMVLDKLLVAYNPGPGTTYYKSPRTGEIDDLVLVPYRWIPVPREYLNQAQFRRDMNKVFQCKEVDALPADDDHNIKPEYADHMAPDTRAFVMRICTEDWVGEKGKQFEYAVSIADQISANGRPLNNSRVSVQYLTETHATTLQAALDLEGRWRKRKPVIATLKKALKKIEGLGKYAL